MPVEVEVYIPERRWWHQFRADCDGVEVTIVLGDTPTPPWVMCRKTIDAWGPCLICKSTHDLVYVCSTDHDPDEDDWIDCEDCERRHHVDDDCDGP